MSRDQTPRVCAPAHDKGMHCIPTKYLRGNSGLSRVEIALLAYVLDNPVTQESRKAIADECGCAANSIPRAAKKLRELGLIETITPPGARTIYSAGRNLSVTRRNVEDTPRNAEVTPLAVVSSEPKQTTTDGAVTGLRGVVTSPPTPPYKNITPLSKTELNPETPAPGFEGGPGETLFGEELPPKGKRPSRAKPKRRATEETMPVEMTPRMREHAAASGFINGTVTAMFAKWRDHHIAKANEIADYEASWRTWVGNAIEFRERDAAKAKPGYREHIRPDGTKEWRKNQRTNVYR